MKHYKMATVANPSIVKQPLRLIQIPLNKFSEDVIPHHQNILEIHKATIHKLISSNNLEQLTKEVKDKKKCVKQLRDLLYELDTLRTEVEDGDMDAFDTRTMPLRTTILKMTKSYQDMEKTVQAIIAKNQPSPETSPDERMNPFEGVSHIQLQANLDEIKFKSEIERLNRVEEIQKKSEDLQEIHRDLHSMVKVHSEHIEEVNDSVSSAQKNVKGGFRNLVTANKLNAVAYPATGAFVGTLLGGPIGLIAGLKVGGIAALGCAFAGYAGGRLLKQHKEISVNDAEHVINNENNENHSTVTEFEKKDI